MLAKSFLVTILTAAALAGANWIGAHIPLLLQYLGTVAAAYGSIKKFS